MIRVFKEAYDVLHAYMIGKSRKNALYFAKNIDFFQTQFTQKVCQQIFFKQTFLNFTIAKWEQWTVNQTYWGISIHFCTFGSRQLFADEGDKYNLLLVWGNDSPVVSSVSCFVGERPRTFGNWRAVIGLITKRSRSFENTSAYWTHGWFTFQGGIGLNVAQMIVELIRDKRKIVDRITKNHLDIYIDLLRRHQVRI